MLLKEEFESTMEQIEPSVNAVIYAGRDLINNVRLHEILYMVIQAGNFLNNVSNNMILFEVPPKYFFKYNF